MSAGEYSLGPATLTACLIVTLHMGPSSLVPCINSLGFLQESTSYRVLLLCKTPGLPTS
jgi:hypothetical protein